MSDMKNKIKKIKDKFTNPDRGKGLQGRWLRNTVGVILALVLLTTVVLSFMVSSVYHSRLEEELRTKASAAAAFPQIYLGDNISDYAKAAEAYVYSYLWEENAVEMLYLNANHEVVASSSGEWEKFSALNVSDPITGKDIEQAFETGEMTTFRGKDPAYGMRIMAVSAPIYSSRGEILGWIRCVSSLKQVNKQIALFTLTFALIGCVLLVVVYVSGRYYVKSILEPISEITATAKRIAAGSYGVQIKRQSDDEIGELSDTINNMSNNLAQSEKTQSEFMSSVSHELRTPLTAISGWSETLLDAGGTVDGAEARRGLNIILRESRRLTSMVEELLEFSRMQDGRFKLNVTMSDIRSEFEDTVFMYGSRLQQEEIKLEYLENDDEIPEIPCDTSRMRQVFLNILDNGAKHGGDGGKITAEICLEDEMVVIRIRDFGPGVPEEELPLIKKKFYKGSSKARGSGIGLAVCEEIVTMHDGKLDITNAEGGGTLVTIRLPVGEE